MSIINPFAVINQFQAKYPVDVEGLAKELGLSVKRANLSKDISGMIERQGDERYVITVNNADSDTKQRFTIAHELGHFIYHRDIMDEGIDDDRAYRSTDVGKYHNTRIGPEEETQANRFAASLLMPYTLISEIKNKGITDPKEVANKLGVSFQAYCIRMGIKP